jgi:DNA repair exonuclease
MRIAHIHDPLIGVIADVYMPTAQDNTWQRARISALKNACESAVEQKADCILISGRLFGEVYVTNAVISEVIDIIRQTNCKVVWMPDAAGLQYLEHKDNLPDNFTLLTKQQTSYTIDDVCIMRWSAGNNASSGCNILISDAEGPVNDSMLQILAKSVPELEYIVSSEAFYSREGKVFTANNVVKMENSGFEDTGASGYHILDFSNGKLAGKEFVETKIYSFKTVGVVVENEDDQKSVLRKCMKATVGLADRDFVRIILTGSVDVETFINTDEIRDTLKNRFFYLEVFNGCELELDEDTYATDISLKSEFIRMVMADDTLSENEKSRIIQCGWNALRGKELSE